MNCALLKRKSSLLVEGLEDLCNEEMTFLQELTPAQLNEPSKLVSLPLSPPILSNRPPSNCLMNPKTAQTQLPLLEKSSLSLCRQSQGLVDTVSDPPGTISPELLKNYSTRRVRQVNFIDFKTEQTTQECGICLQNYALQEITATFDCVKQHTFHKKCLEKWLKTFKRCPLDNTSLEYIQK